MEYKKTLNMTKSGFPMRAGLPKREPEMLKHWEELDLYHELLKKNEGKPRFALFNCFLHFLLQHGKWRHTVLCHLQFGQCLHRLGQCKRVQRHRHAAADRPAVRQLARQQAQQCRFAAAVAANQPQPPVGIQRGAHIFKHGGHCPLIGKI